MKKSILPDRKKNEFSLLITDDVFSLVFEKPLKEKTLIGSYRQFGCSKAFSDIYEDETINKWIIAFSIIGYN